MVEIILPITIIWRSQDKTQKSQLKVLRVEMVVLMITLIILALITTNR